MRPRSHDGLTKLWGLVVFALCSLGACHAPGSPWSGGVQLVPLTAQGSLETDPRTGERKLHVVIQDPATGPGHRQLEALPPSWDQAIVTLTSPTALSTPQTMAIAKAQFTPGGSPLIATVAGNGAGGYSGDNGAASAARLNSPYGVALDSAGNKFIADYGSYCVRRVSTAGVITTVAGTGGYGYTGDNGAATAATFQGPYGVAVDKPGNLYIVDYNSHCVRKVSTAGVITTIAGTGTKGFSGDGGPATAAQLRNPKGVAVDAAGNVFIVDYGNQRIRKINTNGVISTVAGTGVSGFGGDGGQATAAMLNYPSGVAVDAAGNLFIAEYYNYRVRKVDTTGVITTIAGNGTSGYSGDGGPAASAMLSTLTGVAVDGAGNLFITDSGNSRIREVNTAGIITTVGGNGTYSYGGDNGVATNAMLKSPSGLTVDAAGNLFFADSGNNRVRQVGGPSAYQFMGTSTSTPVLPPLRPATDYQIDVKLYASALQQASGALSGQTVAAGSNPVNVSLAVDPLISTVAGTTSPPQGCLALNWPLQSLLGVAWDASGNLYLSASYSVYRVNTAGVLTTVAGTGNYSTGGDAGDGRAATAIKLSSTNGIVLDTAGNLFIAESSNRIRKVDTAGIITTVAGNGTSGYSGDGGLATAAALSGPRDVAVDTAGNLFIVDGYNQRIRKINTAGIITTVAGNGTGGYSGDNGPATSAMLNAPRAVAVDGAGNLFIADGNNNRVRKVDTAGIITTFAGNGTGGYSGDNGAATAAMLNTPRGVKVDAAGNVFISDGNNCLRKVATNGIITTVAGSGASGFSGDGGAATAAQLANPGGLAVDAAGNLALADIANNRVRRVDTAGVISTVAGNGTSQYGGDNGAATGAVLSNPIGVAVDAAGSLYFGDNGNNRVRKVDTSGVITTVAGNGTSGYSGDNGPATSAMLASVTGVAVDGGGNLFIVDRNNNRIRKVDTSGVITTVAGNGTSGYSGDKGPATSAMLAYPLNVAVDGSGNLFISDANNYCIRKVDTAGVITTVAGSGTYGFSGDGGPATSALLASPSGVAVDGAGNLFLVDGGNQRLRKVDTSGVITTVAGNGTSGYSGDHGAATAAMLANPNGVCVDASGNLFIVDQGNQSIREVNTAGVITTVAGNGTNGYSGDNGAATAAMLGTPGGVAVDAGGNLYVVDSNSNRIRMVR